MTDSLSTVLRVADLKKEAAEIQVAEMELVQRKGKFNESVGRLVAEITGAPADAPVHLLDIIDRCIRR